MPRDLLTQKQGVYKSACKKIWLLISDAPEHVDSENIEF
jgi:hypothetical protein